LAGTAPLPEIVAHPGNTYSPNGATPCGLGVA